MFLTATVDVRRVVTSIAINQNDTQVAVVETESGADDLTEDAVVRLYEIGMTRQEDDELVSLSVIVGRECSFMKFGTGYSQIIWMVTFTTLCIFSMMKMMRKKTLAVRKRILMKVMTIKSQIHKMGMVKVELSYSVDLEVGDPSCITILGSFSSCPNVKIHGQIVMIYIKLFCHIIIINYPQTFPAAQADEGDNEDEEDVSSNASELSIHSLEDAFEDSDSSDTVFFELNGDGNPSDPSNASLHAWLQENDDEEEDAEDEDYEPSD